MDTFIFATDCYLSFWLPIYWSHILKMLNKKLAIIFLFALTVYGQISQGPERPSMLSAPPEPALAGLSPHLSRSSGLAEDPPPSELAGPESPPSGPPGQVGPADKTKCVQLLWSSPESDSPVCVCNSTYCDTTPPVQKLPVSQYVLYTSTKAGLRFEKDTASFTRNLHASPNVTVDVGKKYQTILGWGGAFTDAAGININSLNEEAKANLLRSYFSEEGIEYNFGRVPIGGSDFSTHLYSYDDGAKDRRLKNFKLAEEDVIYKIPLIKQAQSLSKMPLRLLGSAWIAPNWMRTQHSKQYGYIEKSMYQVWANYYIKFLQSYKRKKINFWGITTGNEPILTSLVFDWHFVSWSAKNMSIWVSENLGPTLRRSKFRKLKILTLDDQRAYLPNFVKTVFARPRAKRFIDGIAVHWYEDAETPASLLNETHTKYPNKFILGTEASILPVRIGSWRDAEHYAHDIIQDLNSWVTGWIDWNLALDMKGGPNFLKNYISSAVVVDAELGEFYKQPTFYALGHFSKFIPRGSVRVSCEYSDVNLQSVAVIRPDGGTAVVILNSEDHDVPFVLSDTRRGTIERRLPARSVTTILYW